MENCAQLLPRLPKSSSADDDPMGSPMDSLYNKLPELPAFAVTLMGTRHLEKACTVGFGEVRAERDDVGGEGGEGDGSMTSTP